MTKLVVKCPAEVAERLVITAQSEVFLPKRIRYVDEDAVSIEDPYVPAGLIAAPDEIGVSPYDYFTVDLPL